MSDERAQQAYENGREDRTQAILYFLRYVDWQEDTAAEAIEARFAHPDAERAPQPFYGGGQYMPEHDAERAPQPESRQRVHRSDCAWVTGGAPCDCGLGIGPLSRPEPRQDELEAVAGAMLRVTSAPGYLVRLSDTEGIERENWLRNAREVIAALDAARRPNVFPESSRPAPTNDTH